MLDAKWFKMEKERWPDGFDPTNFADDNAEEEGVDDDVVSDLVTGMSSSLFVRDVYNI